MSGSRCVNRPALLLGLCGLLGAASAQTLNENFDDGVANNWTPVVGSTSWVVPSGTDRTYQNADYVANGHQISIYNGASWNNNFVLSGEVGVWGTGSGNQVGLVYRYVTTTDYYAVLLSRSPGSGTGTWQLVRKNGSAAPAVLNSGTYALPSDNWLTVTIERNSSNLTTIKVEGVTKHTVTQNFSSAAKVGVIDSHAAGEFNNITAGALALSDATRPFPRLGCFPIGGPFAYHDTGFQSWAEKFDVVVIGPPPKHYNHPTTPATPNSTRGSLEAAVAGIKSGSPKPMPPRIMTYINGHESGTPNWNNPPATNYAFYELWNKLNTANWWAYQIGTGTYTANAPSTSGHVDTRAKTNYGHMINVT